MSKLSVNTNFNILDIISRYEEDDEWVKSLAICENLPEAKSILIHLLEEALEEAKALKLKDIK